MSTAAEILGPNWPPSPDCNGLPTIITAIQNIANELANQDAATFTTGMLGAFFNTNPPNPDQWIFCDGRAVSRTEKAKLFAEIGTQYGEGDGSTTFNVPNFNGRVPRARDNQGGISAGVMTNPQANVLGGTGGTEFHTLDISEAPPHNHGGPQGLLGAGPAQFASGGSLNGFTLQTEGGGNPHPNDSPWFALDIFIKT